jgi:ferredoxin
LGFDSFEPRRWQEEGIAAIIDLKESSTETISWEQKMKYSSIEELYKDIECNIIDNCLQCGDCLNGCPSYSLGPLKNISPVHIMEKMYELIHHDTFSEEAYIKTYGCMNCDKCIDVCSQGINPVDFNQVVRNKIFASGKAIPMALNFLLPGGNPYFPRILNSILMKPSEARWLTEAPLEPDRCIHGLWCFSCSQSVPFIH